MAKQQRASGPVELVYAPLNAGQRELAEGWAGAKFVVLMGTAGTGKTTAALAHALQDYQAKRIRKIMLCRPTVSTEEDIGFLPGDLSMKLAPWLAPFADTLGCISQSTLDDLSAFIEFVPAGMLRGRTVRDAVLIVDEAQNLTRAQVVCAATRVGRRGKVVLCGDPSQSDLPAHPNPLADAARRVRRVPGALTVQFTEADQLRDEFVSAVLKALA